MVYKSVKEIPSGQQGNIYLLCKEIAEKESTRGKYLQMTLSDGKNEIKAFQWDTSLETTMAKTGEVLAVILAVSTYKDNLSYTVKQCRKTVPNDNINLKDFIPSAPIEPGPVFAEIMAELDKMKNQQVAALVRAIYTKNEEQICKWSAAKSAHHNVIGGLLYHSYRMMKQAIVTADVYPLLNKDILVAGCLLHDIGKLNELEVNDMGITSYTVDGNLLGHALMGCDIVREYGKALNTDLEIIRVLRHIIASHHGKPEYGAISTPAIPEAVIIHELDMIDSRMYMLEETEEKIEPGNLATERSYFLDNVTLYRPNL